MCHFFAEGFVGGGLSAVAIAVFGDDGSREEGEKEGEEGGNMHFERWRVVGR